MNQAMRTARVWVSAGLALGLLLCSLMLSGCLAPSGATASYSNVGGGSTVTVGVTFRDAEIIATVMANGTSEQATRGGDRAVVFGNNYPGTSAELFQCVADAHRNVINLVRDEKFDPTNIRLFINEQCTKANYEKWSRWALVEGVGGRRAFFNSSHGAEDVIDGKLCNVLVTWDMVSTGNWDANTEVAPEFWSKLLRYTKSPWIFLNDSCHSGGQTRVGPVAGNTGRAVRSIEGPAVVQGRVNAAVSRAVEWPAITGGTVFAVCRADQLANEGPEGGVGTIAFWTARQNLGDSTAIRAADIVREANRLLRASGEKQNMNLVGDIGPIWQGQ